MNFSKPENARLVNRLKVLNALRETPGLSRAQLSAKLGVNKVSMGEIAEALIAEGCVAEGPKHGYTKGRPGTSLGINESFASVIGVDIGSRVMTVTLFSLLAKPLRMERKPTTGLESVEDYASLVKESAAKLAEISPSPVIGMCVALNAEIKGDGKGIGQCFVDCLSGVGDFTSMLDLPFPVFLAPALNCAAEAERSYFEASLENMLYVNWGEHLSSALILKDRILPSINFAHTPACDRNLCHCGSVGCLETIASGYGLRVESERRWGVPMTGRDIMKAQEKFGGLLMEAAEALARALVPAVCATGASAVLVGGGLSNLPDEVFARMLDTFTRRAPAPLKDFPIYRAHYNEKGAGQGAGLAALDRYFYRKSTLLKLEGE